MKLKTAKILSIILASIQLLTLLLTALITLNQYAIKQQFMEGAEILELKTIPVSAFCTSIILLILYIVLICVLFMSSHRNTRLSAGILIILGVMLNLTASYIPNLETTLVANTMGANALVSLTALNQAVTLTCTPLRISAFALFCFVIGGYWGLQKEEDQGED